MGERQLMNMPSPATDAALQRFESSLGGLASRTAEFAARQFSPTPLNRIDKADLMRMARSAQASKTLQQAASDVLAGKRSWRDVISSADCPPEVKALAGLGIHVDVAEPQTSNRPDDFGPPDSWLVTDK
ncbi:hypothetical protein FOS14_07140 [Skermania sp. ID1734]|uniref:hypothetical protein n=1 Tax=Skermania sp. ID1734 TaxID=2597516 RepID=UPI00117D1D09|nr:hypothetical protein [Skermania sp. ID1734]TSE00777.1 hypothetical protein FOS14_07140 [Skermania sp. ID1734]